MPGHDQTLARLNLLIAEARDLCVRAREVGLDEARLAALRQLYGDDSPEAIIPFAFQTILGRQIQDWMHRAEKTVRSMKGHGGPVCGERSKEIRQLVDIANVATMKRSSGREEWRIFYRSVRQIPVSGGAADT